MAEPVDHALAYAARGWPVFPCNPLNKRPFTKEGFHNATLDEATIRAWWQRWPRALIGVPTGSASGFWVLDFDSYRPGCDDLANHGGLPATLEQRTLHGGRHLFFRSDAVRPVCNSESKIGRYVDVRGDGGYAILPGSGAYTWTTAPDAPIAHAPDWLYALIERPKPKPATPIAPAPRSRLSGRHPYVEKALAAEVASVATAAKGTRNHTLNVAAFNLGQLVGEHLSEDEVRTTLLAAAEDGGYVADDGARQALATIKSGLEAGMRSPRAVPEPEEPQGVSIDLNAMLEAQRRRSEARLVGDVSAVETSASPAIRRDRPAPKSKLPPKPPVAITAAELQQIVFQPIPFIVPGYIAPGLTILGGKPKVGKSWLVLQIAIAIATGGVTLDQKCAAGSVLYAALEDNQRRLQSRMAKAWIDVRSPWPKTLTTWTEMPRLDDGGLDFLREWIVAQQSPRLVIIDVLNKVRSPKGRDEDPYSYDYRSVTPLKALADEFGIAIIAIHHTRKAAADDTLELVSGTNGLTGAADTVLVLGRDANGVTLGGRGRDIEEIDTALSFDRDTCRWRVLGEASEVRLTDQRRRIVEILRESEQPMTPTELAKVSARGYAATKVLLSQMAKDGLVSKATRGKYALS